MATKMKEKIKMKVCHSYFYFRLTFNYVYFEKRKYIYISQGIFNFMGNKFTF